MRIIAGRYGGRQLATASAPGLRPAMAKTRAALFSSLQSRGLEWEGASVLDLFAGCGSLGWECLSRGAEHVCFVDNSPVAIRCLQANSRALGVQTRASVVQHDVGAFLRRFHSHGYNLVFIDPPYRRGLAERTLVSLCKHDWVCQDGFVVAELEKGLELALPPQLKPEMSRFFGQTSLNIWRYHEDCAVSGDI